MRACGNDKALGLNACVTRLQGLATGEGAMRFNDMHPKTGEAFHAIHRLNRRNRVFDMRHHSTEINIRHRRRQAKLRVFGRLLGAVRRCQQGFGGDTAIIQTIATHFAAFDQNDIGPHLNRARGHRKAARASPNNANICGDGVAHLKSS